MYFSDTTPVSLRLTLIESLVQVAQRKFYIKTQSRQILELFSDLWKVLKELDKKYRKTI